MRFSTANLVHELPNDLRLRILGNKELLGKSQIWVETLVPSAQSPLQILNFGSSSQKTRKSRYQTFLACPVLLDFSTLFQIFLNRIVWANNFLVLTRPSLLQTLIFWHFLYSQGISLIFKENIKQVSCVEIPNLTVLCKQYFACSV